MFKKIGMTLMSGIGGSLGVLYGGAYIAAAKLVHSKEFINISLLNDIFKAEVDSIMSRGKCKPGDKTMLDSLFTAYTALNDNINNSDIISVLNNVKEQAILGAENTKDMEAVKGKASYQTNKGVGIYTMELLQCHTKLKN